VPLHFVEPTAGDARPGDLVTLTGTEAHHAAVVRRVRVGEDVTVGDGIGTWLVGRCESASPREVVIRVDARREVPAASPRLVLVQALAKGDRDELAVQAATELGVDEIVPWQAARSVSRWEGMKADKGRARWETIVREAAKQAHRPWIPQVSPLTGTAPLAERAASAVVIALDPSAEQLLTGLGPVLRGAAEIVLVVGPEGGIAGEELQLIEAAGGYRARLGTEVLRTSTAGPAALAAVAVSLGRW
jgi:16S rRNA (uracil1498-N3)-methyltransferase